MRAPIDVFRPTKPVIGCLPRPPLPLPQPQPSPAAQAFQDDVQFSLKDRDGSDTLSLSEYCTKPGTRYYSLAAQEEFKRYDDNQDGKLSRDEYKRGKLVDRLLEEFEKHKPSVQFLDDWRPRLRKVAAND